MALLTLKDVGKIYVSAENVTVGIRGVNLSFDTGEFVAVTGKSGSGKSTLLNVISGMDSYEEGELYIEGQPTSHYLEPDWEGYREKYISFIFQDYNIIESFTVLQNVELALMNIEDKRERRERALTLIEKVGLSSHVNHKGSRLSGGQKQRTVIARALAKNSPIILADEPTGNLDSETSKEIIKLLREVSEDKLLIVVTHNFDEVAEHATRHIRIFDGSVESDHAVREGKKATDGKAESKAPAEALSRDKKRTVKRNVKNGFTLGRTIFTSKPKLSIFLCLLMIIGTLGIFAVTTLCSGISDIFKPHYMFRHIDGRVVLTTSSGEVLTEDEVKKIAEDYGAESYLRFDTLIDRGASTQAIIPIDDAEESCIYLNLECTYGEDFGDNIVGRYPERANEVFLYLPIYYRTEIGKDSLCTEDMYYEGMNLKIVGVKYYYDNNLPPKCLFTEEGFRTATAFYYLSDSSSLKISVSATAANGESFSYTLNEIYPSFDMPEDKIYVDLPSYNSYAARLKNLGIDFESAVKLTAIRYNDDFYSGEVYYNAGADFIAQNADFEKIFTDSDITPKKPEIKKFYSDSDYGIIMSDELVREIAETVLNSSYKQASLFFENDKAAYEAAEKLHDAGYVAVPSDTTYEPNALDTIFTAISSLMMAIVWFVAILFLAFFINLCSSRVISAFKDEMAIMRSMGIPVTVIRIGMYVRMLVSLIPAFILLILSAVLIFTSPKFNEYFVYLYAWQYALIIIGVLLLTVRITYKQISKLFGESVKKSLKGGTVQ